MDATRAHFGEWVSVSAAANGLRFLLGNKYWSLEEVPRELSMAVALETAFEFIVDEVRARFPKLVIQPVT